MKKQDFQQSNPSLAKFIEENYKTIKEITPLNPSIPADDEWRHEDSHNAIKGEKH